MKFRNKDECRKKRPDLRMHRMLCVLAALMAVSADAAPFYWHGNPWGSFLDAENWTLGSDASPYGDTEANSGGAVPGMEDWIYLNDDLMFDLGGESSTIEGISTNGREGGIPSEMRKCSFTNGSITVTAALAYRRLSMDLWSGSTFTASDAFTWYFGWGGNTGTFNVYDGATLNIYATVRIRGIYLTVHEGGSLVFAPKRLSHHLGSPAASYIANSGTLDMSNGFVWNGTFTGKDGSGTMTIRQNAGILKLGGDVDRREKDFPLYFEINGGVIEVSNSPAFTDLTRAYVTSGKTVTIDVKDGATAEFAKLEYDTGATVVKSGEGTLALAENLPESLVVNAGAVRFDVATRSGCLMSLASGARLVFAAKENVIEDAVVAEDARFGIDEAAFSPGDTVLSSSDGTFLSAVAEGINGSLSGDADYKADVRDGSVVLVNVSENIFDATKSGNLSDPEAWTSGNVPDSGETVYIQGEGTVVYAASSPMFASVVVEKGATLSVSGGTLSEPVDLPPLMLKYDARLLVPEGACAQSTNGIDCSASADMLPVLEVATNATLFLQTPNLPSAECLVYPRIGELPDYGFALKNISLRWYGQIRVVKERGSGNNTLAQARIGAADDAETSYIAIDCQGGTLYRHDTFSSTEPAQGEMTPLLVACPHPGGRVIPVGTLLFRDYSLLIEDESGENLIPQNGMLVGVDNSPEIDIPVVLDGGTVVKLKALNVIAGGARVTVKGSAKWFYEHDHSNDQQCKRRFEIGGAARLMLEDGAFFSFTPTSSEFRGLDCRPDEDDALSLVASNSTIGVWSWYGNGKARAIVADTRLAVGQRYPKEIGGTPPKPDQSEYQTPLFAGFKLVEVPEGATMWVMATNIWRGASSWKDFDRDWNRVSSFGPPVVGKGSFGVTNALVGAMAAYSMTAIVTNGANTSTGDAFACGDSPSGAVSRLLFSDGANWAGTVVANGCVALTNCVDGAVSQAASVTFARMRFDGDFPVRVWKDEGGNLTNDMVNIVSGVSGTGGFSIGCMDGYTPEVGDSVIFGTYPAGEPVPECVTRKWEFETEESDGVVTLRLTYKAKGLVIGFR